MENQEFIKYQEELNKLVSYSKKRKSKEDPRSLIEIKKDEKPRKVRVVSRKEFSFNRRLESGYFSLVNQNDLPIEHLALQICVGARGSIGDDKFEVTPSPVRRTPSDVLSEIYTMAISCYDPIHLDAMEVTLINDPVS